MKKCIPVLIVCLAAWGCGEDSTEALDVICGAGTALNANGSGCDANLSEGLVINSEGQIARTMPNGDEPVISCGDGTDLNDAGDVCLPTDEFRAAAVAEGAASVSVVTCGAGTVLNEAGDVCAPTDEFRAEAVTEGVNSVVVVSCGAGTTLNEAGDACAPNLGADTALDADGNIVPTVEALAAARAEGVASVMLVTCGEGTILNAGSDTCGANLGASAEIDANGQVVASDSALEAARAQAIAGMVPIRCDAGTVMNAAGDACVPNLGASAELDGTGQVVASAGALNEARAQGMAENTPIRCDAGTVMNAGGDGCLPNLGSSAELTANGTIEATQAALDAARAEGQSAVTNRECGAGTAINGLGTACVPNLGADVEVGASGAIVPTAAALAAAEETGRLAGVASVTPLSCDVGTLENNDATMCVANLGPDVEVAGDATIVPTAAALAVARNEGANSVTPLMCGIGSVSNVADDACVGCNTDDDCSATETCTDSRCLGLPVTSNDANVCMAGGGAWDANSSACVDPDGAVEDCVTCEVEQWTFLQCGAQISYQTAKRCIGSPVFAPKTLVSYNPDPQYDDCRTCFSRLYDSRYEDNDGVEIPVAELARVGGVATCRDIDECIPDANGLTPCGDPALLNCNNAEYDPTPYCTDVNECETATCDGDTPICLNAYNDATVVCANRNVVVKHKVGAWIWIQHENGSKWLRNAMTIGQTQICGLTITRAYEPTDNYGGTTQTLIGDSAMFNVGSTYPLGSAAGDPGCP